MKRFALALTVLTFSLPHSLAQKVTPSAAQKDLRPVLSQAGYRPIPCDPESEEFYQGFGPGYAWSCWRDDQSRGHEAFSRFLRSHGFTPMYDRDHFDIAPHGQGGGVKDFCRGKWGDTPGNFWTCPAGYTLDVSFSPGEALGTNYDTYNLVFRPEVNIE